MGGGIEQFIKDTRSPLAKLCDDQPVAHRVFEFAGAAGRFGKGRKWAVRALSADERARAVVDAVKWLTTAPNAWERGDLYTELGESVLNLESKVRALAVGLVDPSDPTKAFAESADELRKRLDADEVTRLFEELSDYTSERSVLSRAEKFGEVEAFVVALGKGWTPRTSLNSYDTDTLRLIITELASRLYGPTKPSSSDTSPPSDSST
jgi:hypothetical protein